MKLTVRIMRMWEHSNMDSTVLHGPNFLMVDHKGNTMEGTIPTYRMCTYENEFQKGVIYTIENFYDTYSQEKNTGRWSIRSLNKH